MRQSCRARLPPHQTPAGIIIFDTKGNWTVLATKKFGITCPICKRFCFLGYVEIEDTAAVGDLRSKLLHQGWKGEIARCDYLKCEGEIFCSWNVAVFPR